MNVFRAKTYAFCGGAFGDEGKGRIVDMIAHDLSIHGPVVVYRDNGGANAGHTVEFSNGQRVALHQLPSGVFIKRTTVVLGKEMVLHPGDLITELDQVMNVSVVTDRATILIDELALLSLDTHRAYESVLKQWQSGGKGSTGRGVSPAYADVLLRHPLRMRDLISFDEKKITQHYEMYTALIKGLGENMEKLTVATLAGESIVVGNLPTFLKRLKKQADQLRTYVDNVQEFLQKKWKDKKVGFVFEKAQAIGLDFRWGVYPDITASDTTFDGIFSATQGVIDPDLIKMKAGVIKATYMSSVGTRKLPTEIKGKLAERIREDAHEYGATTKRPRDIAYLDLPALKFFSKVGRLNSLVLTHMDVCYPDQPIQVCIKYQVKGKTVEYQPDQLFLNSVKPVYKKFAPWNVEKLRKARNFDELPSQAKKFLQFLSIQFEMPITWITTGPQREQGIKIEL